MILCSIIAIVANCCSYPAAAEFTIADLVTHETEDIVPLDGWCQFLYNEEDEAGEEESAEEEVVEEVEAAEE